MLDISIKERKEEDNQLFQWIKPIHLNDKNENIDPQIMTHVGDLGVDVEKMFEEVDSKYLNKDTTNLFEWIM